MAMMVFSTAWLNLNVNGNPSSVTFHALPHQIRRSHSKQTAKLVFALASESLEATPPPKPKKMAFSVNKGQIVAVDKEAYLNSVEYLAVGHPPNYKGLDYIYEDRGEVLDVRMFESGEYALIAWAGIPTSPAWLPANMLRKADKLNYKRF